ncbi:unnamed protein product [Litomosoides sigmodontis]|uniref:Uncharacterized protein n=1 Tax=Litomosoides sigmodontis TaxID=42156 RepID=A0A3P6SQL6_LITSI|nr:unnamed protein product [Litomosoides sigmodontis]
MSTPSHRMASSRHRDAINLTSSATNIKKEQRHLWICSQIHCRIIFLTVQILMIISSLVMLINNIIKPPSDEAGWGHSFIAYAILFGALTGIWTLKLTDNIPQKNHQTKKYFITSPKVTIIPSYIVQICFIIWFAYESFHYLVEQMPSFMERSPLFLFFGVLIPFWITWLVVLYVFAAEINCFIHIINRSRHWRPSQYPPSLLNMRALNNGRKHSADSPSSRNCLTPGTFQERERTKSTDSITTVSSGPKKAYNNTETRIEVIPPIHASEKMSPYFLECSRIGISMTSGHLETVPEESSKSTNSLA